eukprot:TRINITY_DN9679_c0_g1_i3.p1 TRINITY_DN9679_c0_g1~~TRINITY_DN9679_c0_g1_i3.p1  ORF type:complete len:359 (-),score=107.31 TRINITY_DN9679_c0_g1_i3:572-1648(-)
MENILMDSEGNIYVTDFGLSGVMKDGYFLGSSCGSIFFAAPELFQGSKYSGTEIDVWSCGVILYALLVGGYPFDGNSVEIQKQILQGPLNIPRIVSPQAQDLIRKMLTRDPLRRITIEKIKQHEFFKTDVPLYISHPEPEPDEEDLDMKVVEMIARLGSVDTDQVVGALSGLGCCSDVEVRSAQTTYKIIAAEQRRRMSSTETSASKIDLEESLLEILTDRDKLKLSRREISLSGDKSDWSLGIRIPNSAAYDWSEVMIEVLESLRVMKQIGWKRCTGKKEEYKVELEISHFEEEEKNLDHGEKNAAKGYLQLYGNHRDPFLVVDFHLLSGNLFLFMSAAAMIQEELENGLQDLVTLN